jgi:hypothetical protein
LQVCFVSQETLTKTLLLKISTPFNAVPHSGNRGGTVMNQKGAFLMAILIVASLTCLSVQPTSQEKTVDEFFFGVSFGGQTLQEAQTIIDKVKNYTNFIVINSYDLTTNQTRLNEVCDYAAQNGLTFVVYFDFISRVAYPWHQIWIQDAKERWGDKFAGIYLRDEPGGKQLETQELIKNASDYNDAAAQYVASISGSNSMIDAKNKGVSLFTSDFALYWWDYLAGYDTVFVELGWNLSSAQQIALCRGAANTQGKDWGAIIVWESYEPPYLGSAQEVYKEMVYAYSAGAKYVTIFNYPTYPESNPYGILTEEHFEVMAQFWNYVKTALRDDSKTMGEVALVLPKDYGWGMRRNEYISQDNIWGLWPEDEQSPMIMNNTDRLLCEYGFQLDIVYSDDRINFKSQYEKVYYWNTALT